MAATAVHTHKLSKRCLPTSTLLFEVHRMDIRSFEALSFVACHLNCSVCLEIFVMLIRPFETFIWTFILHKNLIPWYLCANVDLFPEGYPKYRLCHRIKGKLVCARPANPRQRVSLHNIIAPVPRLVHHQSPFLQSHSQPSTLV